jgi:hypothetical protein
MLTARMSSRISLRSTNARITTPPSILARADEVIADARTKSRRAD